MNSGFCELLDRELAEQPLEHPSGLARADQGDAGDGVVVERRPPHELFVAPVADVLGRQPAAAIAAMNDPIEQPP